MKGYLIILIAISLFACADSPIKSEEQNYTLTSDTLKATSLNLLSDSLKSTFPDSSSVKPLKKTRASWDFPILQVYGSQALDIHAYEGEITQDSNFHFLDSIKAYLGTGNLVSFSKEGLQQQSIIDTGYFRGECGLGQITFQLEKPVTYGILFPQSGLQNGTISSLTHFSSKLDPDSKIRKTGFYNVDSTIQLNLTSYNPISNDSLYELSVDSTTIQFSIKKADQWKSFNASRSQCSPYAYPEFLITTDQYFLIVWRYSSYLGESIYYVEPFDIHSGTSIGFGMPSQGGFAQPCCL